MATVAPFAQYSFMAQHGNEEGRMARRFPIAVAQRLDIRLGIPRAPAAHPVLAEGENKQTALGRSGTRRAILIAPPYSGIVPKFNADFRTESSDLVAFAEPSHAPTASRIIPDHFSGSASLMCSSRSCFGGDLRRRAEAACRKTARPL